MKTILSLVVALLLSSSAVAQPSPEEVLREARVVNDYFMNKYSDPTEPTFVNRLRTSNLWTRAVYYEGLMALYAIDPQERYLDYTDRWASFHKWTARNGVDATNADDQCCEQTYLDRFVMTGDSAMMKPTVENLERQMTTKIGWWTWIDAIQMAMPVYMKLYKITGDKRYCDQAMKMYTWSRDTLSNGLFNEKEGLWWRDKDYVAPYKEPDSQNCYWSRGNGWVYAALVKSMECMPKKSKAYKQLRRDFILMSVALKNCQREDGFWNPSLISTNYAMLETSGTALFLYGMAWGIRNGLLKAADYAPACHKAWQAMTETAIHPDGFLGWMQGTGKDPSAGQPLSYDKVPDFEDYGTGCVLLGAAEYYRLLNK